MRTHRLQTVRQVIQNNDVRIEVTDTGEGIPREELVHIWERYYRGKENHHRRSAIGTGLGLSIVRTVLDMHGAGYGVQSEGGIGSTFWFELPLLDKQQQ